MDVYDEVDRRENETSWFIDCTVTHCALVQWLHVLLKLDPGDQIV